MSGESASRSGRSTVVAMLVVATVLLCVVVGSPIPVLIVGTIAVLAQAHSSSRRPRALDPPRRPDATPLPWPDARRRFLDLQAEYAAFECDPLQVLHLPALTDTSVPSTARFVDAFAAAQALLTDAAPPPAYATQFVTAVDQAERAWRAARDAARRIRLSRQSPEERDTIERVIKLLTMARDTDSEPERLAAYGRARAELDRLDRLGVVHLPAPAAAALDAASRRELPGAPA